MLVLTIHIMSLCRTFDFQQSIFCRYLPMHLNLFTSYHTSPHIIITIIRRWIGWRAWSICWTRTLFWCAVTTLFWFLIFFPFFILQTISQISILLLFKDIIGYCLFMLFIRLLLFRFFLVSIFRLLAVVPVALYWLKTIKNEFNNLTIKLLSYYAIWRTLLLP